jgi:tripartite ATP-independent transporter DctM subunit
MEWYTIGAAVFGILVVLIAFGLPVPFAMIAASMPFLWMIQEWSTSLISVELMVWKTWVHYILLAVPLFIFLGELVARSSIGPRLYSAMHRGVPVRGAAAYGSIGACAGFGAVCGASLIGALTIGRVALPEMLKLGYGVRLSTGAIAAGGTLSVLIPPSLILIFYGIVSEVSIGALFLGGVVPGLMIAGAFLVVIWIWRFVAPGDVPEKDTSDRLTARDVLLAFAPIAAIALIIIGAVYFGVATPTEAAAVAAVVTIAFAMTIGGMSLRGLFDALLSTMKTMGYLGLLLAGAMILGFVLNYHQVPQQFTAAFVALDLSPYAVLAMVLLFYLVLGMFLDPASMIFITLPTLIPLVEASGYNLLWFGIVHTITMEIAVLTPPVGINLYILQSLAPNVQITDVIIGVIPFICALLFVMGLLIAIPDLALWLPHAAKG